MSGERRARSHAPGTQGQSPINGDIQALPIRELVRASLRHRPDRLLVGEVRGGEAFDLLQTLNTGHSGSLSTIHANSPRHAFSRFTNCVLEAGVQLPYTAIRANIAESIDFIIQVERRQGKRIVSELVQMSQYNPDSPSPNPIIATLCLASWTGFQTAFDGSHLLKWLSDSIIAAFLRGREKHFAILIP